MRYLDAFDTAVQALRATILRSILTVLGIIVGVAAVVLVVAIGSGAESVVFREIRSLGSNLLIIDPHSPVATTRRGHAAVLSEGDASAIKAQIPEVEIAEPQIRGSVLAVVGDINWPARLVGATPKFLAVRDWPLRAGRNFTDEEMDSKAKVVLLGETVAHKLFGDGNPVGAVVRLRQVPFHVIGVLAPKGQSTSGKDQDDVVVIPIKTARSRVLGTDQANPTRLDSIIVKVREGDDMGRAEERIRMLLQNRHRLQSEEEDDFTIKNLAEVQQFKKESARVLGLLVGAVASISLVVGGIGIMNIMLVSVVERTREIGIRVAVGASRSDIRRQFLVEAVTLSSLGGAIGLIVGVAGAGLIAVLADWPWIVSPISVLMAVGFSLSVGIVFGYYPARRASMLDPIEALRKE
jgi:putative ABC transport system permease protein